MASKTQHSTVFKKKDSGGPKKLVIKNLKVKPQLPANFEEETWSTLQKALHAVQNSQPVGASLEELYKATEDLCTHKMAANLYTKLHTECKIHVQEKVKQLINQSSEPDVYLRLVHSSWQSHCEQMLMIRSIFLVLDRTYVIQNTSILSLWDMGLDLFRQYIATEAEVERKTVIGLLDLIERERRGEEVDRSLLKSLVRMLISLQIYPDHFEKAFLEATNAFYAAEGVKYVGELEVANYLVHIESRFHQENERVLHYLDPSSRKPLVSILDKQLIQAHVETMINKGFKFLAQATRIEDLKRMYVILNRVASLDSLRVAWKDYIKATGLEIVQDVEKDKTMIADLLDLKKRLDSILDHSFSSNESFMYALKEAFEVFINSRENKPALFIAKYVNAHLSAGKKGVNEEELEGLLDQVMVLFRYLHGKDMFEAFYKKDLAKRLLLNKSASVDAEKSMISKLKTECGSTFTTKLEGMFKDMDLSKDVMISFRENEKYWKQIDVDLVVQVLTSGNWPQATPIEVVLPNEIGRYQEIFKEFYLSKHSGRKLMWQNAWGQCTLKMELKTGKKELFVSLFQTIVLLLFNDATELSFKDIKERTALETTELRRNLHSLACGKVRILTKNPKGKEVHEDDTFTFNQDLKTKQVRIKINSIQMNETTEEQTKTTQTVLQDRQYQIDAAIVRIMKTRKTSTHTNLTSELLNQLKFAKELKPSDLKKRIESLIDREYLERDPENAQVYTYLA